MQLENNKVINNNKIINYIKTIKQLWVNVAYRQVYCINSFIATHSFLITHVDEVCWIWFGKLKT